MAAHIGIVVLETAAVLHSSSDVRRHSLSTRNPPNTGNIIRLCANSGVRLHLVKPLGFSLEDKQLLRAGLDYHEFATLSVYENWAECAQRFNNRRLFAVSTRNTQRYDRITYAPDDAFLFGQKPVDSQPTYWKPSQQNDAFVSRCGRRVAVSISRMRSQLLCMRPGGR